MADRQRVVIDGAKNAVALLAQKALPPEIDMNRDMDTVPLHPVRQVTYQKKHQLLIQDLPNSDKKRQADILKKVSKLGRAEKEDPIVQTAVRVLEVNQLGLLHYKKSIDKEIKPGFFQSVGFCPPNSCVGCFNLYVGGLECLGVPCCCICYYRCCFPAAHYQKKFTFAKISAEPLPKLYLVDVSALKKYEGESMPSFEVLKQRDLLAVFNFDRCPVFTFVSHKWVGNSPDDASNSLFQEIRTSMSGYVWVDFMCVPQAGSFDVRLPYLKSIPYVIIASANLWTPMKTNEYRRSVWCNMEQFLELDEGLALVEEFRIQKVEDLAPIIIGLKEVLLLLLIHSPQYQQLVGKFVMDDAMGILPQCNPMICGAPQFLVFDRPDMHMLNPTLARICEYYLVNRYGL
jgi:hypothetical protein